MDPIWSLTHGMTEALFSVTDRQESPRFFNETFLVADISRDIVLGMPFF